MAIKEVFANPTVQSVNFEIRFPNLFSIERKVGDLQIRIMERFPESSLIHRRQFVVVDAGPESKLQQVSEGLQSEAAIKVWNFRSEKGMQVNVQTDRLIIFSHQHKTYDNVRASAEERFKELIKYVVDNFLHVTGIPIITRIGLRYIDECPILKKDNKTFLKYYKTTFPLDRFSLSDAEEMQFIARVHKGPYWLRFVELLKKNEENYTLIFDFDGFAGKIAPKDYLLTADELHKVISDEYEASIKEPLRKYMRGEQGGQK